MPLSTSLIPSAPLTVTFILTSKKIRNTSLQPGDYLGESKERTALGSEVTMRTLTLDVHFGSSTARRLMVGLGLFVGFFAILLFALRDLMNALMAVLNAVK